MKLAQKQTHRSTKQNKDSRSKPTFIWVINMKKEEKYEMRKRWSQIKGIGKVEQLPSKESNWTMKSHHPQNKFKMA